MIGTASAKNLDFVRSLGAEEVVDYQATAVEKAVSAVDVVVDTVGGEVGERSLATLRPDGLLVSIAGQPPVEQAEARGVRAVSVGLRGSCGHR